MRILITGSRDWADYTAVTTSMVSAVEAWLDLHPELGNGPTHWVTVVHGACPTGADAMADTFCRVTAWTAEPHPADWSSHGRSAGFRRNAEMVELGADICLAFIAFCTSPRCSTRGLHPSHGASHTADLAERDGIPTVRHFSLGLAAHQNSGPGHPAPAADAAPTA